jgi:hypothetical protein
LEQAVLEAVTKRVLTPEYVLALVKEVNSTIVQDDADFDREIKGVQRQLADVDKVIGNLLDLTERYGAAAAGDRLLAREAERNELMGRLQGLERQRELQKLRVDPKVIKAVLARMLGTLESDDVQAKRVMLKRFVDRVEVNKESARLVYTFPISDTVLNIAAPWGHSSCR